MSLIDKQMRAAKLQKETRIKINELAYKSFNGTRQTARNFREGTLNIGQMGFDNTAEERITKEMITDYHKKEQDRTEERLAGRTKTTLHDTIDSEIVTPVPIPWASTGLPATTGDLMQADEDLVTVVNEIAMHKEVLQKAPAQIDKYENEKVVKRLRAGSTKWMTLQLKINKLQKAITLATTEIPRLEGDIPALRAVYDQIEENIKLNEQEIIDANVENKKVARKYEGVFNEQNKNLYSVKQEPYESELDYIQRIKQLDNTKYDPTLYANRAADENSKELMKKLKEIINDDAKISEIIKMIGDPKAIFDINKYWPKFKETILKIYGPNNKQATAQNYAEFMAAILDTIDTKGSLVTVLTGAEPKPPALTPPPPPTPSKPPKPLSGPSVPVEYTLSSNNKTLTLTNTDTGQTIYLRIGRGEILYSEVGTENTFIKMIHETGQHYFKDIMKSLGLIKANGVKSKEYLELFGIFIAKYHMYENLRDNIGLEETTPLKTKFIHATTGDPVKIGWGMKNDDVPKHAHFGKNIILLNKLYFQNTLSIKDKKMHSVENFPNIKVSDNLTNILYHMCIKNTKPTKEVLNSLNASEKKLFDLLLYVSGLGKNIGTNKDANIKELKDRLKLVESQIRAGNNNVVVKNELKDIIKKLHLYNVISHNNGKAYLKQF